MHIDRDIKITLFCFFISVIFGILFAAGCWISKNLDNNKNYVYETNYDSEQVVRKQRSITYLDRYAISEFLKRNNVQNEADFNKNYDNYEDHIHAVLIDAINNTNTVVCSLSPNQFFQIPTNSLIVLNTKCVIFDRANESKVWVWDPETNAIVEYPFSSFMKMYSESNAKAYVILDRGYEGDI